MNNSQYFFGTDALLAIEDLNDIQKLLVMKINALAGRFGFCFANNKYLAEALKKSESTISRCLSDMEKKGYIIMDFGEDGNSAKRRLFMTQKLLESAIVPFAKNAQGDTQKCTTPLRKNAQGGLCKNAYHNNKEYNTKELILKNKEEKNTKKENLFSHFSLAVQEKIKEHEKERKAKHTKNTLKVLENKTEQEQLEILERSISAGWKGLFTRESKTLNKPKPHQEMVDFDAMETKAPLTGEELAKFLEDYGDVLEVGKSGDDT